MIPVTDPRIEKYLLTLLPDDDLLLQDMERVARQKGFPIIDRLVGRFISLLVRIKNPKLVVELGSGFGYSAYWFAQSMARGKVVLIDYDESNIEYARGIFQGSVLKPQAEFHVGDALTIGQQYHDIDILFIDIDKHQYLDAVAAMKPHLAKDALVIADNTLWYGKVADRENDLDTMGIRAFNQQMFRDRDFFSTIIPLRDGVLVSQKIG